MLPHITLFTLSIYLFLREMHLDKVRYREQDRLGDEHILREIGKFKKEKGLD